MNNNTRPKTLWFNDNGQDNGLPEVDARDLNQELLQAMVEVFSQEIEYLKASAYNKSKDSRTPSMGRVY